MAKDVAKPYYPQFAPAGIRVKVVGPGGLEPPTSPCPRALDGTIEGGLAVDFLEEDLNKALREAGVKRRIAVPRVNVTPNKDEARTYRSYYSDATRGLVADWYQPEIALLGYGF